MPIDPPTLWALSECMLISWLKDRSEDRSFGAVVYAMIYAGWLHGYIL